MHACCVCWPVFRYAGRYAWQPLFHGTSSWVYQLFSLDNFATHPACESMSTRNRECCYMSRADQADLLPLGGPYPPAPQHSQHGSTCRSIHPHLRGPHKQLVASSQTCKQHCNVSMQAVCRAADLPSNFCGGQKHSGVACPPTHVAVHARQCQTHSLQLCQAKAASICL